MTTFASHCIARMTRSESNMFFYKYKYNFLSTHSLCLLSFCCWQAVMQQDEERVTMAITAIGVTILGGKELWQISWFNF